MNKNMEKKQYIICIYSREIVCFKCQMNHHTNCQRSLSTGTFKSMCYITYKQLYIHFATILLSFNDKINNLP